jgi:hypothetical protein
MTGQIPVPMTHKDVDRLLRLPRKSASREPQEQWIIKTRFPPGRSFQFPGGGTAYWGSRRDGSFGLTPYRSNARKYESENAALYEAYNYKEAGRIGEFEVEQLPPRRRLKGSSGTGGRA